MHEMSLVRSLLACRSGQVAAANGGGTMRTVRVQVGPLSGVEPALLVVGVRAICDMARHFRGRHWRSKKCRWRLVVARAGACSSRCDFAFAAHCVAAAKPR